MKCVIMEKSNTNYYMVAIKADNNRLIKYYKSEGYKIAGRIKSDNLAKRNPLMIYIEK